MFILRCFYSIGGERSWGSTVRRRKTSLRLLSKAMKPKGLTEKHSDGEEHGSFSHQQNLQKTT